MVKSQCQCPPHDFSYTNKSYNFINKNSNVVHITRTHKQVIIEYIFSELKVEKTSHFVHNTADPDSNFTEPLKQFYFCQRFLLIMRDNVNTLKFISTTKNTKLT